MAIGATCFCGICCWLVLGFSTLWCVVARFGLLLMWCWANAPAAETTSEGTGPGSKICCGFCQRACVERGGLTDINTFQEQFFLNECVILSNMRLLMLDAWEVGFNFITAHSRGLFDSRSEATIKDVERNHEACFFWLCGFCIHDLL